MKKLMILAVAAMAMATSYSMPTWDVSFAAVKTTGADADYPSDISGYSAYLFTLGQAETYLGGQNVEAITAYLAANGLDALSAGDTMTRYGFDEGVYMFTEYFQPGTLEVEDPYFAVVAFAGEAGDMFRVFKTSVNADTLVFDPAHGGGSAGAWTAVPEPTSALLMLFGVAGLALKRRRSR